MSTSDRKPYLTSTVLDQAFLDACHDNLTNQLELIIEVASPIGTLYLSDRNKYVGNKFYEARLVFPTIKRGIGEFLDPQLEFPSLEIEINNADGRYNSIMPSGANYAGWIGRSVVAKLGLRDVASTYKTIFEGFITDEGGFKRSVKSFTLNARNKFDTVNKDFPRAAFSRTAFPKIGEDLIGQLVPIIYGDWTVADEDGAASVPAFCVNGADPFVDFEPTNVTVSIGSPAVLTSLHHGLDDGDKIELETNGSLPTGLTTGTAYFVKNKTDDTFELSATFGGSSINTSGTQSGQHTFQPFTGENRVNVVMHIAENNLEFFDTTKVYLKRSDTIYLMAAADIVNVAPDNRSFEIRQGATSPAGVTVIDGNPYAFENGDEFLVKVKGKDLGGFDANPVWQARDILMSFGGLLSGDFDANWDSYRDKAAPAESAIALIKSRVWIQEPQPCLEYAQSMLEQVRLEAFVDRNLKFKIRSLHFDDFVAAPSFAIKNWDIGADSFQPRLDDRNNFNRARAVFNFFPNRGEESKQTAIFRNSAAATQASKEISKKLVFPNLYVESDVVNQLKEILKLTSAYLENVDCVLTWRSMLLDVGDFIKLSVDIEGAKFENVPAMIREIGYDPEGMKIPVRLWSFQMCPFPGWSPGYAGIVGGSTATITQE